MTESPKQRRVSVLELTFSRNNQGSKALGDGVGGVTRGICYFGGSRCGVGLGHCFRSYLWGGLGDRDQAAAG